MSGIINFLLKSKKVPLKLKLKIVDLNFRKFKANEIKNNLKANTPLKLYRAENYPGQAPFMRPDTDPKKEFVGRWFTTDKNFVNRFATNTPDTKAIKTLTVDPPIKANPVDRHKTIGELIKDRKKLKDWTPNMGMGENLDAITTSYKGGKDSFMTRLESYLNSSLRDSITLTPPKEIASTSKINTWLSLLAILKNKNPRMFKEILNLIKAKRIGLKTGGIV
tara:strand:+ start:589 stop:1251 length:663 start_codon:yes stop_codon:yes gene_type:complete